MFKGSLSFSGRLYVRFYLALLAVLLVAASVLGIAHLRYQAEQNVSLENFAEIAAQVLPPPDASYRQQREALMRWRRSLGMNMTLYSAEGQPLVRAGPPLPPLPPGQAESGRLPGTNSVFAQKLDDGRWLVSQRMRPRRPPVNQFALTLFIALAVGIAAYPLVRRLTRRLERLQGSVESWGQGKLSTRVPVEGDDEVARVAQSFNQAAERIEALVDSQKSLLANASHELRSPLARIRMASELIGDQASPMIREELNRNIGELDQIIGELLLASRLDATSGAPVQHGPVELTALAAEECARVGATLDGTVGEIDGDARLLRRLLRNLLENAQRYGNGTPVAMCLAQPRAEQVQIDVCDRGPGVPPDQREAIFEPFYRLPGASEAAGGVGLGLALVRQIARHHGGEVRYVDNPGGGCCFRVSLPVRQTGLATIR